MAHHRSTEPSTHYIPAFTTNVGPLQRAVCGAYVEPRTQHSTEPDCEACAAWLNPPERAPYCMACGYDTPSCICHRDSQSGTACSARCGWCGMCSSTWERDL